MGDIRVELELDTGDFEHGVIRANTSLASLEQRAGGTVVAIRQMSEQGRAFSEVLRDWTVIAATAGAALQNIHKVSTGVIGEIIKMNSEVERLTRLLASLSTASDPMKEATKQLADLREQAKQAPFSLEAMHLAFVRLKTGGIDPTRGAMQALVDAVAATGGSDEQLKRAALAFQEMGAKGVVQMKELRVQLAQAIPNSLNLMARAFGVTYEKLTSDIHSGTVNAARAQQALFLEYERTYGGAAQRQMQTFMGLQQQLTTNMLKLALVVGGEGTDGSQSSNGFYGKIKDQMAGVNELLSSSFAKNVAAQIGDGLSHVTDIVTGGVHTLVEYRSAILDVGKAWIAGQIASTVAAGFRAIGTYAHDASTSYRKLAADWEIGGRQMRTTFASTATSIDNVTAHYRAMALAAQQAAAVPAGANYTVRSAAQIAAQQRQFGGMANTQGLTRMGQLAQAAQVGFIGLGGAVRMTATAVGMLGRAFMTAVPYLGIAYMGFELITDALGLFDTKAKDASNEVLRFGAISREQLTQSIAYVKDLQDRLNAAQAGPSRLRLEAKNGYNPDDVEQDRQLQAEINKRNDANNAGELRLDYDEATKKAEKAIEAIDKADDASRRKRLIATEAEQKSYEENYAKLVASKQTTFFLDQQHQEALRQINDTLYQEEIEHTEKLYNAKKEALDKLEEKQRSGTGFVNGRDVLDAQRMVETLGKRLEDLRRQQSEYAKQDNGKLTAEKPFDMAKFVKDGQTELDKLDAKIAGAKAGLMGLDPLVYQLEEGLRLKAVGEDGVPAVEDLIKKLKLAKAEADEFTKALEGSQKLDRDLEQTKTELEEGIFKDQYGKLDGYQQLLIKISNGHYGNPNGAAARIAEMHAGMVDVESQTKLTGNAITDAFRTDKLQAFTNGLLPVAAAMKAIGDAAKSFSLPGGGAGLTDATRNSLLTGGAGLGGLTAASFGKADSGPIPMMAMYAQAIKDIESSGGNYGALGPITKSGDRAYGAYQMMGANIPSWSKDALGYSMTPAEFLQDKDAQDAIFQNRFGGYVNATGSGAGAAGRWFGLGASDGLTSHSQYIDRFNASVARQSVALTSGAYNDDTVLPNGKTIGQTKAMANPDQQAKLEELGRLDTQKKALDQQAEVNKLVDAYKDIKEKMDAAQDGKKLSEIVAMQKSGKYAGVTDDQWTKARDAAKAADDATDANKEREKNYSKAESAQDEQDKKAREAQEKFRVSMTQFGNPKGFNLSSEIVQQMATNAEKLNDVKKEHGEGSPEYKKTLEDNNQIILAMTNEQAAKEIDSYAKKTAALKESLMTRDQAEADQYAKEKERIDQALAHFQGSEEQKQKLAKESSDYLNALAASQLNSSPIGQTLKSYTDISQNVQQNLMSIQGSAIDNLAKIVSGQRISWQQMTQSIMYDFSKSALQFGVGSIEKSLFPTGMSMFGGLFGSSKGSAAGVASNIGTAGSSKATGGLFGSMFSGLGGLFGIHHTGGIVGNASTYRAGSLLDFIGAPRFHTGGIIGSDEVPIIAQKGEGVFTKAQMDAIGAGDGHSFNINSPVTVNANGGDPKQNQDLADKMQANLIESMKKNIVGEIAKQMRPGNMLQSVQR